MKLYIIISLPTVSFQPDGGALPTILFKIRLYSNEAYLKRNCCTFSPAFSTIDRQAENFTSIFTDSIRAITVPNILSIFFKRSEVLFSPGWGLCSDVWRICYTMWGFEEGKSTGRIRYIVELLRNGNDFKIKTSLRESQPSGLYLVNGMDYICDYRNPVR